MSTDKKNNLISVIIPAYNVEDYLERCLRSILRQSYQELEIIVIDDGSEDGTLSVAEKMAALDARIQVVHQNNGGVTRARMRGVESASGEWVAFVDADDRIEPEMYEVLLRNAEVSGADISCCGYQKVFPDHVDCYYGTGRKVQYDSREATKCLLGGDIEPGLCNKLYRTSLVRWLMDEVPIDMEIKNYEDCLLNYYLFSKSTRIVSEDLCLYNYMYRVGSASHPLFLDHKYRDPVKVWQRLKGETTGDRELYTICLEKLAQQLTRTVMISEEDEKTKMRVPYRAEARELLAELNPRLLSSKGITTKTKVLASLALYCPSLYRFLYEHIKHG